VYWGSGNGKGTGGGAGTENTFDGVDFYKLLWLRGGVVCGCERAHTPSNRTSVRGAATAGRIEQVQQAARPAAAVGAGAGCRGAPRLSCDQRGAAGKWPENERLMWWAVAWRIYVSLFFFFFFYFFTTCFTSYRYAAGTASKPRSGSEGW
jgi:hypothetical protein